MSGGSGSSANRGTGGIRVVAAARTARKAPGSKLKPTGAPNSARLEVPRVEGLQRVLDDHVLPDRPAVGGPGGEVEHLEQLSDRHGRRDLGVRARVQAREDHDQPVLGRHDRIEQQLSVLAAGIAVSDPRVGLGDVVAVGPSAPREGAVVGAEQADHPVGHGTHRQQGGHGQRAGAEVGSAGPAAEGLGQQVGDLGQRQLRRPAGLGRVGQPVELGVGVAELPVVAGGDLGQQVQGPLEQGHPLGHRLRATGRRRSASGPGPRTRRAVPPGRRRRSPRRPSAGRCR